MCLERGSTALTRYMWGAALVLSKNNLVQRRRGSLFLIKVSTCPELCRNVGDQCSVVAHSYSRGERCVGVISGLGSTVRGYRNVSLRNMVHGGQKQKHHDRKLKKLIGSINRNTGSNSWVGTGQTNGGATRAGSALPAEPQHGPKRGRSKRGRSERRTTEMDGSQSDWTAELTRNIAVSRSRGLDNSCEKRL